MKKIFERIKIVPLSRVFLHEGVVSDWITRLSSNIDHDGIVKNPIIVTRKDHCYIALDGMHRVTALKALGARDILVYEVDYFEPTIQLKGWDALILDDFNLEKFIAEFADRENLLVEKHDKIDYIESAVRNREIPFAVMNKMGNVFLPRIKKNVGNLDRIIQLLKIFERELDKRHLRIIYTADDQSETIFRDHEKATFLIKRPFFTKEEIVERTVQGKLFPRKSTRHLFPMRPLRVDIDFILLKSNIDIETKNKLLQARLEWCLDNNMVRYYPESVLIFSD